MESGAVWTSGTRDIATCDIYVEHVETCCCPLLKSAARFPHRGNRPPPGTFVMKTQQCGDPHPNINTGLTDFPLLPHIFESHILLKFCWVQRDRWAEFMECNIICGDIACLPRYHGDRYRYVGSLKTNSNNTYFLSLTIFHFYFKTNFPTQQCTYLFTYCASE